MKFDSWSTDALRGYIVMLSEFLSGSLHEDPLRQTYHDRLTLAKAELKVRDDAEAGKQTSVLFPRETVTAKEPDASS